MSKPFKGQLWQPPKHIKGILFGILRTAGEHMSTSLNLQYCLAAARSYAGGFDGRAAGSMHSKTESRTWEGQIEPKTYENISVLRHLYTQPWKVLESDEGNSL
jgi:hypothetical protein